MTFSSEIFYELWLFSNLKKMKREKREMSVTQGNDNKWKYFAGKYHILNMLKKYFDCNVLTSGMYQI